MLKYKMNNEYIHLECEKCQYDADIYFEELAHNKDDLSSDNIIGLKCGSCIDVIFFPRQDETYANLFAKYDELRSQ
jgi:hypothetical protein